MPGFEERIYGLAAEALAEQERQVAQLRSRASVLLAAGAVVPSLLARSVFRGPNPTGLPEIAATVIGVLGGLGVVSFAVLLLRPYRLGFSARASATYQALWDKNTLEQPHVDLALAYALEVRRDQNASVVRRLARWLWLALVSVVLETLGLAVAAALAS